LAVTATVPVIMAPVGGDVTDTVGVDCALVGAENAAATVMAKPHARGTTRRDEWWLVAMEAFSFKKAEDPQDLTSREHLVRR
jgi:hypothetical protein